MMKHRDIKGVEQSRVNQEEETRCWSGPDALKRFGDSLRGLLFSKARLVGVYLGDGLGCEPERCDLRKASAADGSSKESFSPLGALSRRTARRLFQGIYPSSGIRGGGGCCRRLVVVGRPILYAVSGAWLRELMRESASQCGAGTGSHPIIFYIPKNEVF